MPLKRITLDNVPKSKLIISIIYCALVLFLLGAGFVIEKKPLESGLVRAGAKILETR